MRHQVTKKDSQAALVRALILAGHDDDAITKEVCDRQGSDDPEQVRDNVSWHRRDMIRRIKNCKAMRVASLEPAHE